LKDLGSRVNGLDLVALDWIESNRNGGCVTIQDEELFDSWS
jgi:hypothetical protein